MKPGDKVEIRKGHVFVASGGKVEENERWGRVVAIDWYDNMARLRLEDGRIADVPVDELTIVDAA